VAVIGALITGGLGTYTEREANGMLVERPGALREALLGAGVQTVARPAWRVFQVLRTSAWLLILVAFALSLVTSVQGWAGSAERDRRIHSLEQKVDLLYQLPSVPPRVRDAYRQGEAMERAR
jgi:hypothetical protein